MRHPPDARAAAAHLARRQTITLTTLSGCTRRLQADTWEIFETEVWSYEAKGRVNAIVLKHGKSLVDAGGGDVTLAVVPQLDQRRALLRQIQTALAQQGRACATCNGPRGEISLDVGKLYAAAVESLEPAPKKRTRKKKEAA